MVENQAHRAPLAKDLRIRQAHGGARGPGCWWWDGLLQTLPIDPAWENEGEFRNQSHLGSGFVCSYSKLGLLRSQSQAAWLQT